MNVILDAQLNCNVKKKNTKNKTVLNHEQHLHHEETIKMKYLISLPLERGSQRNKGLHGIYCSLTHPMHNNLEPLRCCHCSIMKNMAKEIFISSELEAIELTS